MITAHNLVFGRKYTNFFETVWDTRNLSTGSSSSNQINLPIAAGFNNNCIIDWGDGNIQTVVTAQASFINHSYVNEGIYTIKISGIFAIGTFNYSNDRLKIIEITNWGECTLGRGRFVGCANLKLNSVSGYPKFSNNGSLQSLFEGCSSITTVNGLNEWDLTNIVKIDLMFTQCANFNQDIYLLNCQNVTNSASMFWLSPKFNGNIDFNCQNVTNMNAFLSGSTDFNKNLASFVSKFNLNVVLTNFMASKTSLNYSYQNYDAFLEAMSLKNWAGRTASKVINMGTIKYSNTGKPFRDTLISNGWSITDGGLI